MGERRGPAQVTTRTLTLVGVTALAAVSRVLYWVLVTPNYTPDSDAAQYQLLAENLAAGRGYSLVFPGLVTHPTAFRPPLYPLLLAGSYKVFGTHLMVGRGLNLTIGVVVVVLVYLLAERLGGSIAGLVAGAVAAIYPPLIANDVVLLTEPLSLALLLGMLLAFSYRKWWLAAGLCGLLVLARPSAQYLVLVVTVWALWQFGWKRALGLLGIVGLVISPWVVRNWVQLGSPVMVTSNGFNWAAVYSPQAESHGGFVDPSRDPGFEDYRLLQQDEVAWQSALQRLAFANLRRHPSQVAWVVQENAVAYFELDPSRNRGSESLDGRNLDFRDATLPLFYVVTTLGLVGLVVSWRKPLVVLVLGLVAYFVATSLVLIAAPRLRAPVDVLCCVGVGLFAAWLRGWVSMRRDAGDRAGDLLGASQSGG